VNEHELERLARQLGTGAAERLDVEATARAVVERLRLPEEEKQRLQRLTWIHPEWLRIAASLALLLGAGIVLQRVTPGAPSHYVLEDLSDLTSSELTQVLSGLDHTLNDDSSDAPIDIETLTPSQLEALLRSLDT